MLYTRLLSLCPHDYCDINLSYLYYLWTYSSLLLLLHTDYIPKLRGVTLPRLWRRYLALKTIGTSGGPPPFAGHSVIDAERRTFNWPFFHALIDKVGSPVPNIAEEVRKRELAAAALLRERQQQFMTDGTSSNGVADGPEDENGPIDEEVDKTRYVDDEDDKDDVDVDMDDGGSDEDEVAVSMMEMNSEDEVEDDERNHIDNLVALTGDANMFYDVERWCRSLLWTIQMYIDGYCSDFAFQYGRPYAPSCDIVSDYINEHNGDPFEMHAPVSDAVPLLPHQVAVALLPPRCFNLLPTPLQTALSDPATVQRIFPKSGDVDIGELLVVVNNVPLTNYSAEERRRTIHGMPLMLRIARARDQVPTTNRNIPKPGPKFQDIRLAPVLYRKRFQVTTSPPCRPWPRGAISNTMALPYKVVGGHPLKVERRNVSAIAAAGAGEVNSGDGSSSKRKRRRRPRRQSQPK